MEKKKVIILPTNPSKIGGRGSNFLTDISHQKPLFFPSAFVGRKRYIVTLEVGKTLIT